MQHMDEVAARQDGSSRSLLRAWLRRATWIGGMAALLALPACLGPAGDEAADNDVAGSENEIAQAVGSYPVGVIPDGSNACPSTSDEITIYMDDEDTDNANSHSNWIGKTESSANTRFHFCRVDGNLFKPFSTVSSLSDMRDDYAVLKLGPACPPGSVEFNRFFDNEDSHGNSNSFDGDIAPNESTHNTRLFFCMFRAAQLGAMTTIGVFPEVSLGFHYGVLAPADFNHGAITHGQFRTDEEDDDDQSSLTVPAQASTAARRIVEPISGGTVFHTALVN
jgi:hypothetical protein